MTEKLKEMMGKNDGRVTNCTVLYQSTSEIQSLKKKTKQTKQQQQLVFML